MKSFILIIFICLFHSSAFANPLKVRLKHYKDNNCFDKFGFPSRNVDNYIVKECAPDTLFRWGMNEEVNVNLKMGIDWKTILDKGPIYTSFSPLSTYPYDNLPYRLKIKEGVKFKLIERTGLPRFLCDTHKEEDLNNTILVRINPSVYTTGEYAYSKDWIFWEYDVCSLDVFESISVNSKLAYEEMKRERDYVNKLVRNKQLKKNLVVYIHLTDGTPLPYMEKTAPDGQPILGMDGKYWNRQVLASRLKDVERGLKNRQRFWINPRFKKLGKEEVRRRHFLTNKPTYWNWNTGKSK